MARYGVIADVHGNLQALEAVLAGLDAAGVADILCLGDLVGYNPGGDACIERLRERRAVCIAGNHDLIALGRLGFDRCAPKPEFSLRRTRRRLGAGSRAFLAGLPETLLVDGVAMIHGGVADASRYLWSGREVAEEAEGIARRWSGVGLCFFGHTHLPALYRLRGAKVETMTAAAPVQAPRQLDDGLWFVNPGSVDAARRDGGQAEYAIFDSGRRELTLQRVRYDHGRAEADAIAAGYRMGRLDGALLGARRLLRRARRKAARTMMSRWPSRR